MPSSPVTHGSGGIFISYRREETAANAGRLYDHLSDRFGADHVFMDVDSIAIGVDFTKAVVAAVSACSLLLVLVGKDWLSSTDSDGRRRIDNPDDWIRIEIEAALQRDIPVVPVLVDGAELPYADDLPPSLQPFVRRQAFRLSHVGFRAEVASLIEAVAKVLDTKPDRAAQGNWQLDLVADGRRRKTFRLSSGTESHQITVKFGLIAESIEIDGKRVVRTDHLHGNEFPLTELSRQLGCAVTISVRQKNLRWMQMETLILKVGNQILTYEAGSG